MDPRLVRNKVQINSELFGPERAPLAVLISGAGAPAEFWPPFFCTMLANKGFLVLHGTQDMLVPLDNGEVTARLVPKSKIALLEEAGHMFFHKHTWSVILEHMAEHLSAYN